jgi:hypothetical protein
MKTTTLLHLFTENYNMSNTTLALILLVTLILTIVVPAVSGISSLKQAKAETPGQNGKDESPYIGDKDLLQADATIIVGILILLTISSIKNQALLSLYSFIGLVPFVLSELLLLIAGMFNFTVGSYVAGWFMIVSRLAAIAGLVILTVLLTLLIKYNVQVRWRETREGRGSLSSNDGIVSP